MPYKDVDRFNIENTRKEFDEILAKKGGRDFKRDYENPNPPWTLLVIATVLFAVAYFVQPPEVFDRPVQATVVKRLISEHIRHGRSGIYKHYWPHLLVRYKLDGQDYESNCTVSDAGIFSQLFDGDYTCTISQADQKMAAYSDGEVLTLYACPKKPELLKLMPGMHLTGGGGGGAFVGIGLVFIVIWIFSLFDRSKSTARAI